MSIRAARWLLFGVFVLTVPVPLIVGFDAFVPPIRYLILFAAASAIAIAEGAEGPVPSIMALLGGYALVTFLFAGLVAWVLGRLSKPLSPELRRGFVFGLCGALLLVSILFEIYRTPFAHSTTANLFGVLS
jgi:hypothetical protein